MNHVSIRTIMTVAVLTLALAGCGGDDSDEVPTPRLTVPGTSDRVTDVAAFALTEEELDEVLDKCGDAGGVPETRDDCKKLVEAKPLCGRPRLCILVGVHGEVGVMQVVDGRPGSPACADGEIALCEGIIVPSNLAAALIETSTVATSTSDDATSTPVATTPPTSNPPAATVTTTPTAAATAS
jgi:hypothetical protein